MLARLTGQSLPVVMFGEQIPRLSFSRAKHLSARDQTTRDYNRRLL
jgi:hypothetical protein